MGFVENVNICKENIEDIQNASSNAHQSQLKAWEAEAEKMTANSYACEPEGVPVKIYYSNGDGTFGYYNANPIVYSALHYSMAMSRVTDDGIEKQEIKQKWENSNE